MPSNNEILKAKCEWFEVFHHINDKNETQTLSRHATFEEAIIAKEELEKENPKEVYYIDGWITKQNPEDIWPE